jgi:hypothetical protein
MGDWLEGDSFFDVPFYAARQVSNRHPLLVVYSRAVQLPKDFVKERDSRNDALFRISENRTITLKYTYFTLA